MHKIVNILMILIVLLFTFSIFKYYLSKKNLKIKNFNRSNIDQILNKKIVDLPLLTNDTNNVIVFNDSFESEINNNENKSFWDLLKIK